MWTQDYILEREKLLARLVEVSDGAGPEWCLSVLVSAQIKIMREWIRGDRAKLEGREHMGEDADLLRIETRLQEDLNAADEVIGRLD